MSLNDILGSALSGLSAAQAGLRNVSNNIANINTPGYARELVSQTTRVTNGNVTGVIVGEPSRVADRFLETTVYGRAGDVGKANVKAKYLDQLQAMLGAPGADSSLSARLDAIGSSAIAMTAQASPETIAGFTGNVADAISSMQQLSGDVTALRGDVEAEVGDTVNRVNDLLKRISDLNDSVSRLDGLGRSSAGPDDQRTSALDELSGLIKVTVRQQPDGRVAIDTASGATLLDGRLRQLSYPSSGAGISQPDYPPIEIRFVTPSGGVGPATGDTLSTAAAGGTLGGLLDLRDRTLPGFSDKLGVLFGGLAQTLNAVSNAGTTVPAPATLSGRQTALTAGDALNFTGAATFAVTASDGTLVTSSRVDFSALGAGATVSDAVAAINAGLGGAASATFSGGKLTISASGAGRGVVVAQDATAPSARGGVGFAQYFGLNDIVQSATSPLVPSGFSAGDATGFGAGQTAQIVLRDASGLALNRFTFTGSVGPTFGDAVTELNQSPLGSYGSFALDTVGRIQFQPSPALSGATLSISSDSTSRFGTGQSFTTISGLTGAASGLATGGVRQAIVANPNTLPLARLQPAAVPGTKALGAGDTSGATAFVDQLAKPLDLGRDGMATVSHFGASLLGGAGREAASARDDVTSASARHDDAVNRRDSFSGVNIDEELSQMVVLQNSYSAAARVITTASQMYDSLLAMVG
jgi:flagellar hook-associated protein 1 FlgK